MKTTYITTPIFYVNARPHLGHAYSTIVADTYCRYRRMQGDAVFFQTGTDEHGDKIVQAADKGGVSPQTYVNTISQLFRDAWPPLIIKPDNFIRTTDDLHIKTVQAILQQVYDQGDIYFSEYCGLYCKGCERFLTEKELVNGLCPDHQCAPEKISEQNYFFRMSKYQQWLIDHINANPDFISPERYRNEVLSFLKEPLEDLCISRPTSRLTWGIPLPFDPNFVTYVWFDALINYLTGIGFPDDAQFASRWRGAEHIIAKDILKPHAIYWPTMLRSLGLSPYKKLHVHGYWNVGETKMSKSLGNVVQPEEMVATWGADTVRYFLLREMSFGLDSGYTDDALVARRNSDLANDLGNLFSRSLAMVAKFSKSVIPHPEAYEEIDRSLAAAASEMIATYTREMDHFLFNRALSAVWEVISRANKFIVETAPWELAKEPANRKRLDTVLYTLLETLRLLSLCLRPVMPETAERMATALGVRGDGLLGELATWGGLKPGGTITPPPPLFPRLEDPAQKPPKGDSQPDGTSKKAPASSPKHEDIPQITFDEFKKVDLRVAEVRAAERIKKSDRLLKLTVAAPEERTIVAGIAEHFTPEEMVGKQVIIVANLKPAKLMGVASHGMVLAVRDGERLLLSAVSAPVSAGCKVS